MEWLAMRQKSIYVGMTAEARKASLSHPAGQEFIKVMDHYAKQIGALAAAGVDVQVCSLCVSLPSGLPYVQHPSLPPAFLDWP